MTTTNTDDVTHLRALLAEQTTRAERAEVDYRRVLSERAAANQLAGRCAQQRDRALAAGMLAHTKNDDVTHLRALLADATARAEKAEAERDAALAANAEMRAALECAVDDLGGCLHGYDDNGRMDRQDEAGAEETLADLRALLSRTDLGAGKVLVERAVVIGTRDALRVADRLRRLAVKVVCLPRSIVDSVEAPASLLQAIDDMNRDEADFVLWEGKLDALLKKGGS